MVHIKSATITTNELISRKSQWSFIMLKYLLLFIQHSERTGRRWPGRDKNGTYPCQPPPALALRRLEGRWRGWLCPQGVQELLRECPRVRGGGGLLRLRLRHPDHFHPRDSSTPSTWTQIRTHVMTATAAWRRPLPRPDPENITR